ncbi:mucin-5AC-like [Diaphorina citri]|uniref:Mucin-5AC-like n=1 Tax=Diaphorina citri TaxID=121845 RepID=A0A3Q0IMC7_DIACI|nr:mucin-5AC-like [Diaphorina citri]
MSIVATTVKGPNTNHKPQWVQDTVVLKQKEKEVNFAEVYYCRQMSRGISLQCLCTKPSKFFDLITGLGIPKDKLVLAFPTHAYQFQLANASLSLPQSPALGAPKLLTQAQLCKLTKQEKKIILSKYIALSNLAGAAIMDIQDQDWSHQCGGEKGQAPALVRTLYDTFTQVIRKPRQTQLLELQQQLHEHSIDAPTRVVRVVDHEGATHVVRRDVVVNFQCSRQGYFVHPTGCNRFYRCVKFNQYTDDWTVFEYDCPAGLAFDERWEVCVWPGSLPDGGACQGSSEIAPVPRNRFQCPAQPGYYADPENCRWFFACLDHAGDGVTPLTAYEFRCPFSLVFNEQTLVCDWPWNVQGCGECVLDSTPSPTVSHTRDQASPYAGLSGQYDAGKYSAGSGEHVSSADQYSGGQYSGSSGQYSGSSQYNGAAGQYSGAKLYTGSPVVSTTATPFVSTQYSTAGLYSGAIYTGSPLPVSTTISPFLSTQAGQYTLSNGLTYSGPSVAPTFAASKSVLHHSSASVGTASTLASTTASRYSGGVVSSTTPGYSGVGGVYSGVSLSGEKFGVDGESGHIHSPFKVNNGFEQYTGGFDNIAYQVNSLQPSLSENVDGNGYSTSGKVFFSPTPTPGGFSSYTPSSYGTSTPNPFYGSSTSLPGVFSSLYPGKSYVSTTPAPVPYSSFSSAKSTTATPVVASYSTPRPVSYGGASYSTTPAPVVSYSSTPAPFSPSYSPSVASYSPSPIPYSPSVGSYSPSPAPYSPSVISYSSTPAPYAPSGIPYSPSVSSYPAKSAPYSPSGSHYSPSPAPYSPSTVSYSTTPAPVVSYSSTPAPYSPSVVSYSSTPAPYPSYSPSVGSYSSGARYSPSVSSYSPTPAPYSPSVTSYSTPAPVASYSPSPSPVSFASYPSPKPVAYTPGFKVYTPSSTVAPAIVSYSTPAPKTYYPTSTPVPIVQYSSIAPPLYSGSLTGFPGHSQYTGGQAYVSGYAGPSFSQGYESQQYSGSYSAGSSEYNAGASAGKVQYGRKSPISYSTTTEKGSYASPSDAPAAYSTTVSPINTYSAGSNVYSGSDYSSGSRYQNYVQSNAGYSASQAYSGDEYLPPLESVPAYDVKKPCDHPAAPVPSAYAPAPAIPYQTFLSSGYEQVKYQTPYVFESSTPAPPDYNRQSFQFRPIVVQPLPEVSSFKDYFYSMLIKLNRIFNI